MTNFGSKHSLSTISTLKGIASPFNLLRIPNASASNRYDNLTVVDRQGNGYHQQRLVSVDKEKNLCYRYDEEPFFSSTSKLIVRDISLLINSSKYVQSTSNSGTFRLRFASLQLCQIAGPVKLLFVEYILSTTRSPSDQRAMSLLTPQVYGGNA